MNLYMHVPNVYSQKNQRGGKFFKPAKRLAAESSFDETKATVQFSSRHERSKKLVHVSFVLPQLLCDSG